MMGLIVNVDDDLLPESSPWRTRDEDRAQAPLFYLADGYPVFEVWRYHEQLRRWFCFSTTPDPALARQGVIYYHDVATLKAWIARLGAQ